MQRKELLEPQSPALPRASYLNETTAMPMSIAASSSFATPPITTKSELAAACKRMAAHPFVTIDTEFLRETTYYPLLCVAQMASSDEAVVVDALAPGIDLAPCQARSASDLRYPGRRHGARLWRFHLLRPTGAAHHRRQPRQIAPIHRLDAPAIVRGATHLRHFRRHPSARRLPRAGRRSRPPRPRRLGRGRDASADLARDLPHGSAKRLAAAQDPRAQTQG